MTYKDKREKVINALWCCTHAGNCGKCGYGDHHDSNYCLHRLLVDAHDHLKASEPITEATWEHYTNDEGKARWKCTKCGKICRRNPHDKARCSRCGAHMGLEA